MIGLFIRSPKLFGSSQSGDNCLFGLYMALNIVLYVHNFSLLNIQFTWLFPLWRHAEEKILVVSKEKSFGGVHKTEKIPPQRLFEGRQRILFSAVQLLTPISRMDMMIYESTFHWWWRDGELVRCFSVEVQFAIECHIVLYLSKESNKYYLWSYSIWPHSHASL
jgi:hypothetical protein